LEPPASPADENTPAAQKSSTKGKKHDKPASPAGESDGKLFMDYRRSS
jgi:hypothetical protein